MNKSLSTSKQTDYWLRKTEGDRHYVRIRMNHEQIEKQGMEEEDMQVYWQCDEVEVEIPKRADVEQYVKNHYKALFYFAEPDLLIEKLTKLLEE